MTHRRARMLLWSAIACLSAATALAAQEDDEFSGPEAIIYRDANYTGPAMFFDAAAANIELTWRVGSVRVPSGRWELCEKPDYQGECRIVEGDVAALATKGGIAVQSIRPLPEGAPAR